MSEFWGTFWVLVGFHVFVVAMLALDLGVFQRKAREVSMKEAAIWSGVWVALAFLFAFGIYRYWHLWHPDSPHEGGTKAIEFITGYLVEKSLSVDNLFVFMVIFRYFAVPRYLQHRVLYWGILGALILRATLILLGAALLAWVHATIYVFGLILIYTGYKLACSVEKEIDPGKNLVLRLARRLFPVLDRYEGGSFWVKRDGIWHATPLPLVLLVVESTDVMFAIDSIPAVFGITTDTFIVYTSNIFAILGLRALYFLLANFLGMFRYLSVGLAAVLIFVGLKMILMEGWFAPQLEEYGIDKTYVILASLGVIVAILGTAIALSLWAGPKEPLTHPPEEIATVAPATDEHRPAEHDQDSEKCQGP